MSPLFMSLRESVPGAFMRIKGTICQKKKNENGVIFSSLLMEDCVNFNGKTALQQSPKHLRTDGDVTLQIKKTNKMAPCHSNL